MKIAYGNYDDSLTQEEVTKDELTDIIQSYGIVNLVCVENHEINENGLFDVLGGITNIGDCAFLGCSSLTTITLPKGLIHIGSCAFDGCTNLTTITLPEGIANIGEWAFGDCFSLTSITLPASITNIGGDAFSGCYNLQTIIIDGDEHEVERVKALLPEALHDKVISKSLSEEALFAQKEAIIELAATPQFSSLYKWQAYLKPAIADSILGIINSYLIDDESLHRIFHMGRQEIENIPLRFFSITPSEYIRELSDIKEHYKNVAEEKIKPSIKWQFYDTKKETPMQEEKSNAAVTKRSFN
jgi:hypothetical protein